MAIQTIERYNEILAEEMVFLTVTVNEMAEVGYVEPVVPVEAQIDQMTVPAVPVHEDGLLTRMGRDILAFYVWLFGPPMSARERTQREIAEAERKQWYLYP